MLGGSVVRRLRDEGVPVCAVDLREPAEPLPGVRYAVADVRDRAALARVLSGGADAVVHTAAALPSYPAAEIRSVIVDGTAAVLAAAADAGVGRVVHVSSTAVYGLPSVVPTTEDHPREPVDSYGRAKAAAEEACERYRAAGLCVPVLRPKTFVGPGRMGLFSMLFEWADDGRNFPVLGRGDVRIQMCAIDDLLDAVGAVLAADAGTANDTFNIAAERFGTLREDFQAVLDAAGHGKRVVSIPARPAVTVLQLLQRARLSPVYGRLLHKLLADSYVSIAKAQRQLGFAPRFSNQDALRQAFGWFREQRAAGAAAGGPGGPAGRTSRDPWRQGVLAAVRVFF
jgi:nucleoside-diphosphate-sugar epimerase